MKNKLVLAATLTLAIATGCSADTSSPGGCSVEETQEGALVTCDDGSSTTIKHGETGEVGETGKTGETGETGEVGEAGEIGDACQIPASTLNMISMNEEAWRVSRHMEEQASENLTSCNQPGDQCWTSYLEKSYNARFFFAARANVFPLRTCGTEIYTIVSTKEEYVASDGGIPIYKGVDTDFDGDGISNRDEFWMNLNPCTPKSYGCQNDADLDFDADEIPNGEDEFPFCNWDDPGHWETACI